MEGTREFVTPQSNHVGFWALLIECDIKLRVIDETEVTLELIKIIYKSSIWRPMKITDILKSDGVVVRLIHIIFRS
jgi:hypothetical protein